MENTRVILLARMHLREDALFAVTFLRDFSVDFCDECTQRADGVCFYCANRARMDIVAHAIPTQRRIPA